MTSCADLDPFFDSELSKEAAAEFREHLAGCSRCEVALRGRMEEEVVLEKSPERAAQHRPASARPAHRARRHRLTYLAPILAAAAAVAIWLGTREDPGTKSARSGAARSSSPTEVALAIERRGVSTRSGAGAEAEARGSVAQVGDVLRLTVRGEDHRAIWVYLEDRDLVIACPDGPGCSTVGGSLTLELPVSAAGRYSIIAISSAQPILTPHGPLDMMLGSIAAVGAHFEIKHVDVN
jgi:putative zinc finger protein